MTTTIVGFSSPSSFVALGPGIHEQNQHTQNIGGVRRWSIKLVSCRD